MTRTIRLAARQALLEQRSFWRSAEYALFTFAFPLMILLLIGLAFGAVPRADESLALAGGLVLGTVCFAALGLAISSVITSAESAGPVAYAIFLPIAIISGVFDPTFSGLPDWLSRLVAAFPVKALAEVLQNAYAARPFPAWDLVNLALWTAAGAAFAVWRFRWHS